MAIPSRPMTPYPTRSPDAAETAGQRDTDTLPGRIRPRNLLRTGAFWLGLLAVLPAARLFRALTLFDLFATLAVLRAVLLGPRIRIFNQDKTYLALGFLYLAPLLISGIAAIDPAAAMTNGLQATFAVVLVLLAVRALVRDHVHLLCCAIGILVGSLCAGASLVMEGISVPQPFIAYRYSGAFHTDGQQAGLYLAVAFGVVLGVLSLLRRLRIRGLPKIFRVLYLTPVIMAIAMTYAVSRSGALGLALSGIAFFTLARRGRRWPRGALLFRFLLFTCVSTALMVGYVEWAAPERVVRRVDQVESLDSGTVRNRTDAYSYVIGDLPRFILLGVGGDNASHSLGGTKPHNIVLLAAMEAGVIGAVALVILILYVLRTTWRAMRSLRAAQDPHSVLYAGLIASTSGYVVVALLNTLSIQRFPWLVFALGIWLPRRRMARAAADHVPALVP